MQMNELAFSTFGRAGFQTSHRASKLRVVARLGVQGGGM